MVSSTRKKTGAKMNLANKNMAATKRKTSTNKTVKKKRKWMTAKNKEKKQTLGEEQILEGEYNKTMR